MKSKISITIDNNILKSIDGQIDGLKIRNRSQAIESILSKNLSQNKIATILASKMSNFRFSKEINNEKIIIHLVKKLQNFGFKKAFCGRKNNFIQNN